MCDNCDICKKCGCDPCSCNKCCPADFGPSIAIKPDLYDPRYWHITLGGATAKVRVPDMVVPDVVLDMDCVAKTLTLIQDREKQVFAGSDLGCLIKLEDLADVNVSDPESCSILVRNPACGGCPCDPEEDTWQAYKIPDATEAADVDDDGYYRMLGKNDCGCIVEKKVPVMPSGMTAINYLRDSVPDDPDFPWYYGCYNDTINLHLAENAPAYFGKYALKVTVNYGIQAILSDRCVNTNFRSLLVPVTQDETVINVEKEASILQGFCGFSASGPEIPWGTQCLRGSFVFIVPKGKEARLHHEFRYRTNSSFPNYYLNSNYDGKRVPDVIAEQIDQLPWNASRLNALQIIVEPTFGVSNYDPVTDAEREQLDDPVDEYPSL